MEAQISSRPTCAECGKTFRCKYNLTVHMRSHTGDKPYRCRICEKAFTTKAHSIAHMSVHKISEIIPGHSKVKMEAEISSRLKCAECGKTFRCKSNLNVHMRIHTGDKPYSCRLCGKAFRQSSHRVAHMSVHKISEIIPGHSEVKMQAEISSRPKCAECGKTFSCKGSLTVHMRIHTGDKPYSCRICGKAFRTSSHNVAHMSVHNISEIIPGHSEVKMAAEISSRPTCTECGKTFSCKTNLTVHMRIHTGDKPYSCRICGKAFRQSNHRVAHMSVHKISEIIPGHSEVKMAAEISSRPTCAECGKTFSCKSYLPVHMRIHTGDKPYSCRICGKAFRTNSKRVAHMSVHNNSKIIPGHSKVKKESEISSRPTCAECGKTFSCKSYLTVHMRIHTGDKPYSCRICGKAFRTSSHILKHMSVHKISEIIPGHSEMPMEINKTDRTFKCLECGKTFRFRRQLSAHNWTHLGFKPYKSSICQRSFSSKSHKIPEPHVNEDVVQHQQQDQPEETVPVDINYLPHLHSPQEISISNDFSRSYTSFDSFSSHSSFTPPISSVAECSDDFCSNTQPLSAIPQTFQPSLRPPRFLPIVIPQYRRLPPYPTPHSSAVYPPLIPYLPWAPLHPRPMILPSVQDPSYPSTLSPDGQW